MQISPRAFTLIELLVVVTIIVVLLALLTPALDKAIYQTELTVCAAQIKTISSGAIAGAVDHKRYFPDRTGIRSPHQVASNLADTRPALREYLGGGLDAVLTDPFNEDVDLEASPFGTNIYGSYYMFFGWQISTAAGAEGGPGMRRVGDRWTWRGRKYDTFVMDYNIVAKPGTYQWSTHPDADGVLGLDAVQHSGAFRTDRASEDASKFVYGAYTFSAWVAETERRGLEEMNASSSDGSVARYDRVKPITSQSEVTDERMVPVSNFNDGTMTTQIGIVPRAAGQ